MYENKICRNVVYCFCHNSVKNFNAENRMIQKTMIRFIISPVF